MQMKQQQQQQQQQQTGIVNHTTATLIEAR
jgi:hypothetical protein